MATTALFPTFSTIHDPVPAAVDEYTTEHLVAANDALSHALANSAAHGLPDIMVSAPQGKCLMLLARLAGASNVLELGTLGGYSALWLSEAGPAVRVTSVEVDEAHKTVADANICAAGRQDRVAVVLGRAIDVLATLADDVRAGRRARFDFVFIDADKENSWAYFDRCVRDLVGSGACIYVDNVVRSGALSDEARSREDLDRGDARVWGVRRLVEEVGRDTRVDAVVVQTVGGKGYDGHLMAVVK